MAWSSPHADQYKILYSLRPVDFDFMSSMSGMSLLSFMPVVTSHCVLDGLIHMYMFWATLFYRLFCLSCLSTLKLRLC